MKNIDVFKALSNESRLQIMEWLKEPEKHFIHKSNVDMNTYGVCVGEIQKKLGLTQSTTSHYLSILQKVGLLESVRIGRWTYYKRSEENIQKVTNSIKHEL